MNAKEYYAKIYFLLSDSSTLPEDKLKKLRTIAEQVFSELTKDAPDTVSTLSEKMTYYFETNQVRGIIKRELTSLRKLANDAVHQTGYSITPYYFNLCCKVMVSFIHSITQEKFDTNLKEYIIEFIQNKINLSELYFNQLASQQQHDSSELIRGIILTPPILHTDDSGNKGLKFRIEVESLNSDRDTFLVLPAHKYYHDSDILPESLQIDFFKSFPVFHLTDCQIHYSETITISATTASYFILEPDYLIDASDIDNCFEMSTVPLPVIYLMNKFEVPQPNINMMRGSLVNTMLDLVLEDPKLSDETLFSNALRDNIDSAYQYNLSELKDVRTEIERDHLPQLRNFQKEVENKNVSTEPTYFSALYGIQGRIDVLSESPDHPQFKEIFELKSSKPPFSGVYTGHKIQTIAYHLLLRSTYGKQREGRTSLFYSKAPQGNIRAVPTEADLEKQLFRIRNGIIQLLFLVADNPENLESVIDHVHLQYRSSFKFSNIEKFNSLYSSIKHNHSITSHYFKTFASAVLAELRVQKIGNSSYSEDKRSGFSALWNLSIEEKQAAFSILLPLKFVTYDQANHIVEFSTESTENTNFREGDICLLYPHTTSEHNPLAYPIIKGGIEVLTPKKLCVKIRSKSLHPDYFSTYKLFALEHDFFESNQIGLLANLTRFVLTSDFEKHQLLWGLKEPEATKPIVPENSNLLPDQAFNIGIAIAAKDYYLIQGPPGTGKTSVVIMQILLYTVQTQKKHCTVLAYTNRAVDEICNRLESNGMDYILLSGSSRNKNSLKNIFRESKTLNTLHSRIKSVKIYVSTVTSYFSHFEKIRRLTPELHTLIVDEASQLLEPHLIGILPAYRKFILVGDHFQLPAVSQLSDRKSLSIPEAIRAIGITDLRHSLFERLWHQAVRNKWDHAYGTLKNQFRMHLSIQDLINKYYDKQLQPGKPEQTVASPHFPRIASDRILSILASSRVIFINTSKGSSPASRINKLEAEITANLLESIYSHFSQLFTPYTVGVITPWRAQISAIRSLISDEKIRNQVSVDTVERYQGSEREIIIISLSTSDSSQLERLSQISDNGKVDRKLNVAVTRAQHQLIILGDAPLLYQSRHYGELIDHIKHKGRYIDDYFAC